MALFANREVLKQEEAALAGSDEVQIAVTIQVDDRDLHAPTAPRAIVDDVFDPLYGLDRQILIPIDSKWFTLARISSVVSHISLSRDQIGAPIFVEIDQ
jgi:hypothetical protein